MDSKIPLIIGMIVLTAAIFGCIHFRMTLSVTPGIDVGSAAHEIVATGVDSSTFSLKAHREEVVIIEFMTTTCPYCVAEFVVFKQFANEKGVYITSISLDYNLNLSDLRDFAEREEVTWFMGGSIKAGVEYQVRTVPTVLLIDKDGIIQYRGYYTSQS